MSQHITDHPRERSDGKRAEHYAKIERETSGDGPHPASDTLQRRAEVRNDANRAKEYLRVERDKSA